MKLFVAILKTHVNPTIKRPAATAPAKVLDRSVSDAMPAQVEPVRHHRWTRTPPRATGRGFMVID